MPSVSGDDAQAENSKGMTKIRYIVKWLLPFQRVEQLAPFRLLSLELGNVVAVHEQASDKAGQQADGMGDDKEHKLVDVPGVRSDLHQLGDIAADGIGASGTVEGIAT